MPLGKLVLCVILLVLYTPALCTAEAPTSTPSPDITPTLSPDTTPTPSADTNFTLPEGYFPSYLDHAVASFNKQKYKKTLSVTKKLKKATERLKAPDKLYLLEGLAWQYMGERNSAAESFRNSLSYRRSNSDAIYYLAMTECENEQAANCLELLKEALWFERSTLIPPEEILYQMGVLYEEGEEKEQPKAAVAYLDALKENSNYAPAQARLSEIYLQYAKKVEAKKLLEQAVKNEPENREVRLRLARALLYEVNRSLDQEDIADALKLTSGLLKDKEGNERYQDPAFPVHVRALLDSQQLPQAEQSLMKALKAYPDNPELLRLKQQIEVEKLAELRAAQDEGSDTPEEQEEIQEELTELAEPEELDELEESQEEVSNNDTDPEDEVKKAGKKGKKKEKKKEGKQKHGKKKSEKKDRQKAE